MPTEQNNSCITEGQLAKEEALVNFEPEKVPSPPVEKKVVVQLYHFFPMQNCLHVRCYGDTPTEPVIKAIIAALGVEFPEERFDTINIRCFRVTDKGFSYDQDEIRYGIARSVGTAVRFFWLTEPCKSFDGKRQLPMLKDPKKFVQLVAKLLEYQDESFVANFNVTPR